MAAYEHGFGWAPSWRHRRLLTKNIALNLTVCVAYAMRDISRVRALNDMAWRWRCSAAYGMNAQRGACARTRNNIFASWRSLLRAARSIKLRRGAMYVSTKTQHNARLAAAATWRNHQITLAGSINSCLRAHRVAKPSGGGAQHHDASRQRAARTQPHRRSATPPNIVW